MSAAPPQAVALARCTHCGYDLRGLPDAPAAAPLCPECGADLADSARSVAGQIDTGLALVTRGLPFLALACMLTLAAENWISQTVAGLGSYRGMRPAWAVIAMTALAPTLGLLLIGWVIGVARPPSAPSRPRGRIPTLIIAVFAGLLLLTLGYFAAFGLHSGNVWYNLGAGGVHEHLGTICAAAAFVAAGASAALLSCLSEHLRMWRVASLLRRVAIIGTIAAVAWLIICSVLQSIGNDRVNEYNLATFQQPPMIINPDGSGLVAPPPRPPVPPLHWFWWDGVALCWTALYAWCAALMAALWIASIMIRARLRPTT